MKKIVFENSLAYLRPDLALEWGYERNGDKKPEDYTCGSHQKVFWQCSKGHIWEAEIQERTKGTGCPYCSGNKVLTGYNDFASRCQNKMYLWNYEANKNIQPEKIYFQSCKKVWWRCDKGHEWEAKVRAISTGSGCIYCTKQRVHKGVNDLGTLYPEISKFWDYELNEQKPSDVFPKSAKRVHWKCSNEHRWEARIHSVVNRGGSCPVCSKKRMAKGVNDFATVADKALLEEWNYDKNSIAPDEISAHNSKIKVWWKCRKCKREWELSVSKRLDRGDGCPYCSGKRVIKGKNDLATIYPEVSKWWSGNNIKCPEQYFPYSHAKAKWQCPTCSHEFVRRISDHVKIQTCPNCTGTLLIKGKNDLATKNPILIEEWNHERNRKGPEEYKEHSNVIVWWKCSSCEYDWRASINNRSQGRGCPRCGKELYAE